jgi:stress-induced-phosphoprotein 1
MQSILNQAKNDPAALQNHMQNATIRTKIQKVSISKNLSWLGRVY